MVEQYHNVGLADQKTQVLQGVGLLAEETRDKKLTPWYRDAVRIIDDLTLEGEPIELTLKRDLLVHLMAQRGDWRVVERLRGSQDDYFAGVADRIIYDDTKVELYDRLYREWAMNRARVALARGANYHDIHEEYDIDRDELRALRRKLFEEGRLDLGLTEEELTVKKMRDQSVGNAEIAETLGIVLSRVGKIAEKLILMGLIGPGKESTVSIEKRQAYDQFVDYIREGNEVEGSDRRGRYMLRRLKDIGELPRRQKSGWNHTDETKARMKKIKKERAPQYILEGRMPNLFTTDRAVLANQKRWQNHKDESPK